MKVSIKIEMNKVEIDTIREKYNLPLIANYTSIKNDKRKI